MYISADYCSFNWSFFRPQKTVILSYERYVNEIIISILSVVQRTAQINRWSYLYAEIFENAEIFRYCL